MGGIVKMSVLITHDVAFGSPLSRPLNPTMAVPNAARALIRDTETASKPRVAQPKTSTGVHATAKNIADIAAGINMWRKPWLMRIPHNSTRLGRQ